jgi:hypothetical protein
MISGIPEMKLLLEIHGFSSSENHLFRGWIRTRGKNRVNKGVEAKLIELQI